jgi:hypothetical protein
VASGTPAGCGGGQFQPEAGGDGILRLTLLDPQHEQRFVFAGALGDGLADELQRRGQAGHGARRIGEAEIRGGAAEGAVNPGELIGDALGRAAAERAEQTRVAGVQAVEDRRLLGRRRTHARTDARVVAVIGTAGAGVEAAAVLRALEAQAVAGDVVVGVAEIGAVFAAVDPHRPVLVLADAADVDLVGLPRPQPFLDLIGVDGRIAGQLEGLHGDEAGGLVVAVAVALVALEARQQHPRPAGADHPHHVAHHVFAAPLLERLFEPLRKAVVDHRGEVLLVDAVVAIRHPQFLGADQP